LTWRSIKRQAARDGDVARREASFPDDRRRMPTPSADSAARRSAASCLRLAWPWALAALPALLLRLD